METKYKKKGKLSYSDNYFARFLLQFVTNFFAFAKAYLTTQKNSQVNIRTKPGTVKGKSQNHKQKLLLIGKRVKV